MSIFKKKEDNANKEENGEKDLTKLKKKEILEIMVRQGEEIDKLNARITELEKELEENKIEKDNVGSIAEASLAVTNVFEEADKAAKIYLENIRRKYESGN